MAHDCAAGAKDDDVEAGFVDLGIAPKDCHTAVTSNPDTASSSERFYRRFVLDGCRRNPEYRFLVFDGSCLS